MWLNVVPGVGDHVVKSCSRCGCSKHWLQSSEQSTTTTLFSLSLTLRNGIVSTKTLKSKLNEGIFLRRGHIWHGWHVCCIGYALWNWFISAIGSLNIWRVLTFSFVDGAIKWVANFSTQTIPFHYCIVFQQTGFLYPANLNIAKGTTDPRVEFWLPK